MRAASQRSPDELRRLRDGIAGLSPQQLIALARDWDFWARPSQRLPEGLWHTWVILAGRMFGKTRTAVESLYQLSTGPDDRVLVVGATRDDCRKICFEGKSGLVTLRPEWRDGYNRNEIVFRTPVGTFFGFGAQEPDRFRGPEFHRAWLDEYASHKDQKAVRESFQFGLRLGENPQTIITTTPRPTREIKELIALASADHEVRLTKGFSMENAANIAPRVLEKLLREFDGTAIGRQELYGEIVDDVTGSLWKRDMFRHLRDVPELVRIVVAVDPSGGENGDEVGIVVAGQDARDQFHVLADYSGQYSANGWAAKVVWAFDEWKADFVVAETNFGGDMVEAVLRNRRSGIPFRKVVASRGKMQRATPVVALYEQGRVHHVLGLGKLEDQQCTWIPPSNDNAKRFRQPSPGRLDAAVWALTELAGIGTGSNDGEWKQLAAGGFSFGR